MVDKIKLTDDIYDRIHEALEAQRLDDARAVLQSLSTADVATLISVLDDEENKVALFRLLDHETAGEVLDDVDPVSRREIIEGVAPEHMADILETMPTDEAADAIGDAEDEDQKELLDLMEAKEAADVRNILKYEEDSAGGIMIPDFVSVRVNMTADEAIEHLRKTEIEDEIFYVYVVDESGVLVGLVSLRALIVSQHGQRVRDVMDTEVHTVRVDADQEEVARISKRYDLVAVPVVDARGVLLGRVLHDDIVDVIEEEATEDIYRLAGTTEEELYSNSSLRIAWIRLPWLFITFAGCFMSAYIISIYKHTLEALITITFFIPFITAMGGNSGLQSVTVVVRGIATGHLSSRLIARTVLRELRTAIAIALTLGILMAGIAIVWQGNMYLGLVVGISMFLAITMTTTLGVLIPLLLRAVKVDPAIASGPLVTMLNDIVGLMIYLTLSMIMLSRLSGA